MTDTGDEVPVVVKDIDGLDVTVYEVIGSLEKGAVNVNDTVVAFTTVAVPTVGVPGTTPFPPDEAFPSIGILLSFHNLHDKHISSKCI